MTLRVLVAVDIEHPESWTDVRDALAALVPAAAELHVLYVLPEVGSALVGAALPEGFEREALERAGADLAALLARHPAPDLPAPAAHVAHGPVETEILAAAHRLEAGLLALHGPDRGLAARALGSLATAVARDADLPVLLVPAAR